MTQEALKLAREAGFVTLAINEDTWGPYLERFAKLVQERYAEMHTSKWSPKIQQIFNKDGVLESQTIQYTPQSTPVPYPPQRTWVGLESEEIRKAKHHIIDGAYHYSFKQGAEWAEAKLKEKNGG